MGRMMGRIYRRLAGLSPKVRQSIIGIGQAVDPLPDGYKTFKENDQAALRSDWNKVGADMWVAVGRAERERHRARG